MKSSFLLNVRGTQVQYLLEVLVLVEIESTARKYLLEVLVLDELDYDVLLRLDLEHLEDEAEEGRGLDVPSEHATNELQLHGLVYRCAG